MEAALLQALRANPADLVSWLALADHLEEQGKSPQATFIRLQQSLLALPLDEQRPEVEEQIRQMLADGIDPVMPALVNSVGMRLTLIPAGSFRMGTPENRYEDMGNEHPCHLVTITRPFYLGAYQVTQQQYERVTGHTPSYFSRKAGGRQRLKGVDTSQLPVDSVTWDDCQAFCERLSVLPAEQTAGRVYRLPTEAEWEYACRAGASSYTRFHTGEVLHTSQANYDGNCPAQGAEPGVYLRRPAPVGSYRPNAWGLYDMHGNVWEWCADRYDGRFYEVSPAQDPVGPDTGTTRVLRGGSWDCVGDYCRTSHRLEQLPLEQDSAFGFRVVCGWPAHGGA